MTPSDDITIRTDIRPGDLGLITYLHGILYRDEYGYGISFESTVAGGLHEFYNSYDPQKDCSWIAEHAGMMIGCLVLKNRGSTAQLRYFLIRPEYRGVGLGNRLLRLFMEFAKASHYQDAYLWTTNDLGKAAHLYQKLGFRLTEEKPSTAFGKTLVEQRYDLIFQPSNLVKSPY